MQTVLQMSRATAITWLAEKAAVIVADKVPSPAESQAVIDAADALKQLDNTLAEKMGDQAPMVTELSRPLKNYKQRSKIRKTLKIFFFF